MIRKETIDQIRETANIADIIGSYLPLKRVGKYFRGVCPFHPDKSPSFYVSPERQVYHCFGCGAGGSVINFVMQFEKVDFPEAVKILAGRLNITVRLERVSTKNQSLYDACEFAAQFFAAQLPKYTMAVNYLLKRGMKDETVQRFRLGYAPGGNPLRTEAKRAGFNEEILLKAGLLARREQGVSDWFFGRILCPITSISGRVVGFSGRVLDDSEPKYLNSTETEIFRKGENLFGIYQAKNYLRAETPILVEGNFDLLALANRGINNVVAPLGTAFTSEQAMLLKRFNSQVRILFDSDPAGRNAARRALEVLLRVGLEPGVVSLPADYDPDEFIREQGKEKLLALLQQPSDVVAFKIQLRPTGTVAEKNSLVRELLQLLATIPDEVMRELYLNRIAREFQVSKEVLAVRVKQATAATLESRGPNPGKEAPTTKLSREEKLLAVAALYDDYARIVRDCVPLELFRDPVLSELARRIYERTQTGASDLAWLIDSQDDESMKRRIASWEFVFAARPSPAGFRQLALVLLDQWFSQSVAGLLDRDDLDEAKRLRDRHSTLRRQLRGAARPKPPMDTDEHVG
jgi:DNA primase